MTIQDNIPCRRCGQCCEKGGPTLHREDLHLARSRVLDLDGLVTLRAGEPVLDEPKGRVISLKRETVKIRGKGAGWSCLFLERDPRGLAVCSIYEHRPAQCRAFSCTAPSSLAAMYDKDRVERTDILPPGHPLLELMAGHEAHCPAGRAVELAHGLGEADEAEREERLQALAPLLAYDQQMRDSLLEHAPDLAPALPFLLGRPLEAVLAPLGLDLERRDGRIRLRPRPGYGQGF